MKILHAAVFTAGLGLSLGAAARAEPVTLTGPTSTAGTYSTSDLAAAGASTPSSVVSYGGYTGISLWGLLGGANASSSTSPIYGDITTSTPAGHNAKNAILRYYVVGTSINGARSVVSCGQIDPNFGGTGTPVFVAYQETGGPMLATPELVVPGGPPGSTLANLTSLQLLSFPAQPTGAGGQSTTVTLSGNVKNPGAYTLSMLQSNFTPVQQTLSGDTYTGIPLLTFINSTSPSINNQIVVGWGTDGYEAVYSLSELANLNNIIAYAATGTDFPADGVARTITPADNAHGRFLSNLLYLEALNWNVGASLTATHDFNGDAISDVLWIDGGGDVAAWLMNAGQVLQMGLLGNIGANWSVIGQRDFNYDGQADLLLRDSAGDLAMWFMNGLTVASSASLGNVPTNWSVFGTGDLNGDGKGDLLWRDSASGSVAVWFMNGSQVTSSASLGTVPSVWTIVGDDSSGDIFWLDNSGNYAVWKVSGGQVATSASLGNVVAPWLIAGLGDFNGDGNVDILWRNSSSGEVAIWFLSGTQVQSTTSLGTVGGTWAVVQTGDYNGDGKADILWMDGGGNVAVWFMNGAEVASTATVGTVPAGWSVVSVNAE